MSSASLLRVAARSTFFRSHSIRHAVPRCSRSSALNIVPGVTTARGSSAFSTSAKLAADKDGPEGSSSHEETFEEFTARCVPVQLSSVALRAHKIAKLEVPPASHWQELSVAAPLRAHGSLTLNLEYRFEKEFDGVQDVFELQVCNPFPSAMPGYLARFRMGC